MDIQIYTNEGCIWCTRTKELMARANVEYNEIKWQDLKVDEQLAVKTKYPGVTGFPVVIIDDENIGGLVDVAKLFLKKGLVTAPSK